MPVSISMDLLLTHRPRWAAYLLNTLAGRSWPGGRSPVCLTITSVLEPPETISNSAVKRHSADGSVGFPHVRVGRRQASSFSERVFNSPVYWVLSNASECGAVASFRRRERLCGTRIRHAKRTRFRGIQGRRGALKVPDTRTAHLLSPSGRLFLARQRPGAPGWELSYLKSFSLFDKCPANGCGALSRFSVDKSVRTRASVRVG